MNLVLRPLTAPAQHRYDGESDNFIVGASYPHGFASGALVRRLTPLECERLQSFPDGWTCLDVPLADYVADPESASERCRCPDSPRYRAIGNAVTVNVVEWLARRLLPGQPGAAESRPSATGPARRGGSP